MKRFYKKCAAFAVLALALSTSANAVEFIPSNTDITLDDNTNSFTFTVSLDAEKSFAGVEIGLKPSDGVSIENFELVGSATGESSIDIVKNGVHYYAFYSSDNKFTADNEVIANVTCNYSGDASASISLDSASIVYADLELKKTTAEDFNDVFTVNVTRETGEDQGSTGGGGGGSGGGNNNNSEDSEVEILDPETPLSELPPWTNPFTDVTENDWFYDTVRYSNQTGLFSGTTETTFSPNETMTRAMLVTVLYRVEQEPLEDDLLSYADFQDVEDGSWYELAVGWAAKNGIVMGVGDDKFAPNEPVTREQVASILYRYATFKGEDTTQTTDISKYFDHEEISDYAKEAMTWANARGFITGATVDTLNPLGNASRAELATILMRYLTN